MDLDRFDWLARRNEPAIEPDLEIVDRVVCQSSDNEFHCYSMVLFYKQKSS